MIDHEAHEKLNQLLMDVPLSRGVGSREARLDALVDAALFVPVFPDRPSPVPSWLDEGEELAREIGDTTSGRILALRRAAVAMRRQDFDDALARAVDQADDPTRLRCWAAVTRCRVHTRQHDFEAAATALAEAERLQPEASDWIAGLLPVARGELLVERDDSEAARTALTAAQRELAAELVEERIQVAQALGFLAIARRDSKRAARHLTAARRLLAAAGAWREVIEMGVAIANLDLAHGRTEQAEALLEESLALATEHDETLWEPMLRLGLARSQVADLAKASEAAVGAAAAFARAGDSVGFFAMISYLSQLHLTHGDEAEGYRLLVLGVSISKRLAIPHAEAALRSQIDNLRERLGAERLDELAQQLVAKARGSTHKPS